jgi:hypothetical protein
MAQMAVVGETRYYYTALAPWRIVLVLRGDPLESLAWLGGTIVDALVGWDNGSPGFVLPENERRKHTKITLLGKAPSAIFPEDVRMLSEIIFRSPRSDRRGGYRGTQGRRPLDGAGTHQVRTTLTNEQYLYAMRLGDGDISKGLREAVTIAINSGEVSPDKE